MRRAPLRIAVVLVSLCFAVQTALAFNWNGKTALHELDVLFGNMKTESGHPLATHNAFREAVARAEQDAAVAAALTRVLGESLGELLDSDSDALQTVLFGNWLNEIRTNIDAEGSLALDLAARLLRLRYRKYLDGRVHSDRWQEDTRYSSSNYQHSMMVSSIDPAVTITQDDVFDLIDEYTFWALTSATMNLAVAIKGREDGSMTEDDVDLSWVSGLRYVGSVFHVMEDSSVSCTPEALAALEDRGRHCVTGDGHGIVAGTDSGRRKVVSLSNNEFYERSVADGSKPHAELDDLYRQELIATVHGEFDPALVNAQILIGVTTGAAEILEATSDVPLFLPDGVTPNDAFDSIAFSAAAETARQIHADVIATRYASVDERLPLPPVPDGSGSDDRADGEGERDDMGAGGCAATGNGTGGLAILSVLALGLALSIRRRR